MSWIQVHQTQTIEAAPPPTGVHFRLAVAVVSSHGIEPELFVFGVNEDDYSHVAGIDDLRVYPGNRAEAVAQDLLFYRRSSMEMKFHTQPRAAQASEGIQARLAQVNREWGSLGVVPFGGVETFVYDSAEP
jgi:hypothetical protein